MKTILLLFCLTCVCVQAQTPVNIAPGTDPATVDALTRQALRAAVAGSTNVPLANAAAAPAPAPVSPLLAQSTNAKPAFTFPAFPTPTPRPRRNLTNSPAAVPPGLASTNIAPMVPPAGIPMAAAPAPVEAETASVDINFPGVSLDQVLEFYSMLVGRTVLRANLPPNLINLKTTAPLTKTEAIQALDSVLAMNGVTTIPVGEKFVKVVLMADAGKQGTPFSTSDETTLPEADQYVTHIVQLKYIKTADAMQALQPLSQIPTSIIPLENNGILIIRDYAANVKRMLEMIKQIDVTVPLDFDSEVIPIKYGKAEDIASALSSLGAGGGTSIGRSTSTGGGARPGGLTGGLPGSTGYGNTGGINGTLGNTGGTPGFGGATGGARSSSFSDRVGQIVKRAASQGEFQVFGQTKIIADERTNSLLVFASKQDMAMIKSIVAKLDIVLAQVLIEAIIMEVTLDNTRNLGVSYLQNNPTTAGNYFTGIGGLNNGTMLNPGNFNPVNNVGTNSTGIPSGLSYFANFGGDFQATVTAIATDDRVNVLSRPRIQTSHGVPASLQVGSTVNIVSGTYFGGINGQASSQYQQQFVGIQLTVTPLINPDGLVVMDIMQDVEQLGPTQLIDNNQVPTTSKRTAQATVSVRDRDTIILGGMISTSKSSNHSGVPLLKDIPGLGYLFRSGSDTRQRVELIVLIHPTVLPTPEVAALVTAHERDKLPGIKAAEADSRLDEIRRAKEADKIQMPKERD